MPIIQILTNIFETEYRTFDNTLVFIYSNLPKNKNEIIIDINNIIEKCGYNLDRIVFNGMVLSQIKQYVIMEKIRIPFGCLLYYFGDSNIFCLKRFTENELKLIN